MDITSRLKEFINMMGRPVTQFADKCNIPRPTMSQLLNGRNKKISDAVIGKIHAAFPEISVLWLMFGEGDMLHNANKPTSSAQNGSIFDFPDEETPQVESIATSIDFESSFTDQHSNNYSAEKVEVPAINSTPVDINTENTDDADSKTTITFNPFQNKKIVNIIVYYDDNSFESFIPGSKK